MAKIKIDSEKCVCCGDCAIICPVLVYNKTAPPCQIACPLNTDIQGYIYLIAQGKLDEAYDLIRDVNPLPITCGRVCTRPCEHECARADIDNPVAICSLKRFVTDYAVEHMRPEPVERNRAEKVAIIGAGPAGLSAAHDLAKMGYAVVVFEALPVAGGLLFTGIPEFRLPRSALQKDINNIKALGVDIKTNNPIGKGLTIDGLWHQGYQAILLATGAQRGLKLGVPGEDDFNGVIDSLKFLKDVNLGRRDKLGDRVVVIGGGNAAIDSAMCALRLGSREISIVYRRSREEMPAIDSEVEEAKSEGVKIHFQVVPSRILGEQGKVVGVECIRTELGKPDGRGRRQPEAIKGSEFRLEADVIIPAIGQQSDITSLTEDKGVESTRGDNLVVDPDTLATSRSGIFAAGDIVTGPSTVIDVIAAGKRAALSIDQYLRGVNLKEKRMPKRRPRALEKEKIWGETPKRQRQRPVKLPIEERISCFKEVDLGFARDDAVKEAKRCLGCGIFCSMDVDSCCGLTCQICMYHCWQQAIEVSA